jgi:hypothetical protein
MVSFLTSVLSIMLVTRTFADFDLEINDQINPTIIPTAPKKLGKIRSDSGIGCTQVTTRITIPPTASNAMRNIFNDLSIITFNPLLTNLNT